MDELEPQLAQPKASLIPGLLSLVFHVPNSVLKQADMPTPGVTLFKDCKLPNKERVHEFGTHVFIENEDAGNYQAFRFVPRRSHAQIETQIETLSKWSYMKHPWDDCLIVLGAIEDATQPLSFDNDGTPVTVPRLFGRRYLLPGGMYASRVDVEVYVSHTHFPDAMKSDLLCPVPGQIQWQSRNLNVNLNCLHDDVEFEETQTEGTVLPNWGTKNVTLTPQGKAVFPATNPPIWVPHYYDIDESDPIGGMRRLTKLRVHPPLGVEEILNAAV